MDLTPTQALLAVLELAALVGGLVLLGKNVGSPEKRRAFRDAARLRPWSLSGWEALLLIALIFVLGNLGVLAASRFLKSTIALHPDRAGLEVFVYGLAMHLAALLGWPLFFYLRNSYFAPSDSTPPVLPERTDARRINPIAGGVTTWLMALPVVAATALVWSSLLRAAGFPVEPQDVIAIFSQVRSPWVIAGLGLVACVTAPIYEETLFRRCLYHVLRQRVGQVAALLLSGGIFSALHLNLAGFLPLAVLGAILALAYERTGDIRVSMIAHGLFNLNTIVLLYSGLSQ